MIDAGSREPRDLAEAARRAIVPVQLRRKGQTELQALLLDPQLERDLGTIAEPQNALRVREEVEEYLATAPPESAALVCTAAVRPFLADFLLRSGVRLDVFAYGEVPPELRLAPARLVKA